jgi:hypothetical protein
MHCLGCGRRMARRYQTEVSDDCGLLLVKVWRCSGCWTVIEEIYARPRNGKGEPRRVCYPVRPWAQQDTSDVDPRLSQPALA